MKKLRSKEYYILIFGHREMADFLFPLSTLAYAAKHSVLPLYFSLALCRTYTHSHTRCVVKDMKLPGEYLLQYVQHSTQHYDHLICQLHVAELFNQLTGVHEHLL